MSTIRVIYFGEAPNFPATDQHPDAKRYKIEHALRGTIFVDAVDGKPTMKEINAFINPVPPSE